MTVDAEPPSPPGGWGLGKTTHAEDTEEKERAPFETMIVPVTTTVWGMEYSVHGASGAKEGGEQVHLQRAFFHVLVNSVIRFLAFDRHV